MRRAVCGIGGKNAPACSYPFFRESPLCVDDVRKGGDPEKSRIPERDPWS